MTKVTPRILIIQPTSLCNLNCNYCYISEAERQDSTQMSMETLAQTIKLVFENLAESDHLTINWHAGEPLTAGIEYYEAAIKVINKLNTKNINIKHVVQTNGILINTQWVRFFKEHNFWVGLSIDGPEILHDTKRLNWKGNSSFKLTMKAVQILQDAKVEFSGLTVLSKETLDYPEAIFEFFLEHQFYSIGYNIEINFGSNNLNWTLTEADKLKLNDFWDRTIQLWSVHGDRIRLREVEDQIHLIQEKLRNPHFQFQIEENQPLKILLVDKQGDLFTYTPTLAFEVDVTQSEKPFQIGNINNIDNLDDLLNSETLIKMTAQIQRGIDLCQEECVYFDLCGGGCPGSKLSENGTFESTITKWCEFRKIALTEVILENRDLLQLDDYSIYGYQGSLLNDGIKVLFCNQIDSKGRLHLSSGVQNYSNVEVQGVPYKDKAFVPKKPWRKCNVLDEKKLITEKTSELTFFETVGVVKLPVELLAILESLKLSELDDTRHIHEVTQSEEYKLFIEKLLSYLNSLTNTKDELSCLDICMNTQGMPTTSIDQRSGKLVGLHLDSWDNMALTSTQTGRNRICINIGKEERYFSFCNVAIKDLLQADNIDLTDVKTGVQLASKWFEVNDDYPIVRLKVLPGEAYISPTENILHDGITDLKQDLDLHLTVLGYFYPQYWPVK